MKISAWFIRPVLTLPRTTKKAIAVAFDASLCVLTVWIAYYLRLGAWFSLSEGAWPAVLGSLLLALPIFTTFGLYRAVFRFVSWQALIAVVQASAIYGILFAAIFTAYGVPGVPRTVGIIQPVLLLIFVGGTRASIRYLLGGQLGRPRGPRHHVLVYGAGSAGRQLAAALSESTALRVCGFVDDDRHLHGQAIGGTRVWPSSSLSLLVERYEIDEVLLAIPSLSRARRKEILRTISAAKVGVRSLPGLMDIAHGRVITTDLRPLEIDDLLGRDPVPPEIEVVERNIRDATVLVTGAGGSIGSELCRQIEALAPSRLLLVDASEYALYAIHRELSQRDHGIEVVPLLASVVDAIRMRSILDTWRPSIVFHAAAYKHVPLVEHNVIEGVRNNVLGTWVCASLAQEYGVAKFILVSTDKAVRPTNVMGASKRLAEMVLQALAAQRPATCFSMVRFGNVLGSSGSVVPLFRQQIAAGGPVTITHPEVVRYFMTIPEAAQLVLQAGTMAEGGEVFVLDMGEPVKVVDLATRMIELSGLTVRDEYRPHGDIELVFTGLRPGEKLYEELLIGDNPSGTAHPRIMAASEQFLPAEQLMPKLEALRMLFDQVDVEGVRRSLIALVHGFTADRNVDWVLEERERQAQVAEFGAAQARVIT
ncbi:polysaccharide biosynthesis protein [Sphingomonas sp.]|uniref:polysaccharide biosynthesis protein n=1 Tax=Sphingomonas sp. TaxID=28214 RepID=UPI0035BBEDE2